MKSSPPRLLDDPAIGPALAEEIAEARAYDPTALRRRSLDGAAARSGGLGATAGAGAAALGLAALVAWLWVFPKVETEGPRTDDLVVSSPDPAVTVPNRRPPLASASRLPASPLEAASARGAASEGPDLLVGLPMTEVRDEPMPERGDQPSPGRARAQVEAAASAKPASRRRIDSAADSDVPHEDRPDAKPERQVSVPAEPTGPSIAPALPSGEARTTGLDDLASDLEDYDRGHASLLAGDLERAVDQLQDYLDARPLGRLRLEARLDLLEALIRLNRPAEALPLAEALLGDPAADNRRAELTRVVVELRVATGDCRGARRLASKSSQALLEAVQKCEDGGG